MLRSFKSRTLRRFWERDDAAGLRPDWTTRLEMILDALNAALAPEDMNLPGLRFHRLKGDRIGTYSLRVSRNWRITFGWDDGDAVDIDLEDDHGD